MASCSKAGAPSLCISCNSIGHKSSQNAYRRALLDPSRIQVTSLQLITSRKASPCTQSSAVCCYTYRGGEVGRRGTSQKRCQFQARSLRRFGTSGSGDALAHSSVGSAGGIVGASEKVSRQEHGRVVAWAVAGKEERPVAGAREKVASGKRDKTERKENDVLLTIKARWGRCVFPWLERNVEYSAGAVLTSLSAYQAYFDACAGGEVVDDSEFVTAVESYFRWKGDLVQHYKGIGGGAFRNLALVTPQVGLEGQQSDAERQVSNTERAESGRAASTSASRSSSKGGKKQQQGRPPKTETASRSYSGASVEESDDLDWEEEEEWGRGVLNSLIGGQAAWLSGPLFVLASEKKNREAEEQNSALRERLRTLKEAAGLSRIDGEESVKGVDVGHDSVNRLGAGGTLETGGGVEGSGNEEVADRTVKRAGRGRKALRQKVGADEVVGRSAKRLVGAGDLADLAGETESDSEVVMEDRFSERGLDVVEERGMFDEHERGSVHSEEISSEDANTSEDANGVDYLSASKRLRASNDLSASESVAKTVGSGSMAGTGFLQLEGDEFAGLVNGVSREEFLQRLEGLEKGLGARAESLARQSTFSRNGTAEVLVETVAVNGTSAELDGRAFPSEDKRQLRAVGSDRRTGKFPYRGDGSAGNGSPLDPNYAVAMMVAKNKRVQMLKFRERTSAEREDGSESDGELLSETGYFADSANDGGVNASEVGPPRQNGAAGDSQVDEIEGWQELGMSDLLETDAAGVFEVEEGTSGVPRDLGNGSAAVEISMQNGVRESEGQSGVGAKARDGSDGLQGSLDAYEGLPQNGSVSHTGAKKGLDTLGKDRGLAANGLAPPGASAAVGAKRKTGARGSAGENGAKPEGRENGDVSLNGRAVDGAVENVAQTNRVAPVTNSSGRLESGAVLDSKSGSHVGVVGARGENGASLEDSVEGKSEAPGGARPKVNGTPVLLRSGKGSTKNRLKKTDPTKECSTERHAEASHSVGENGIVDKAVSYESEPLRVAEGEGALAPIAAGGENGKEGVGSTRQVGSKPLPPPLPVVKKRESSRGMIARGKGSGESSSGGTNNGRGRTRRRRSEQPEDSEVQPMLVTASHKIGEEPPIAMMAVDSRGVLLAGNQPPGKKLSRNYTLEEDEKLFEELGFRLTGAELGRVEEWLRTKDVPELKLPRPRDRNGRYFVMPVIEKVEKHLKAHGRLQREPDVVMKPPAPVKGVLTPAAVPSTQGGENTDEFFRQMSKELSADVVSQTQEQFAEGGEEKPVEQHPSQEPANFAGLFEDDSSDSDVETLFEKAGLSGGEGEPEALADRERVQIAEYLMGLNGPGNDPPNKEDWPCTPDGERYSKETVRGIWRAADEMGGLDAFLTLYREEEKIERLLVETLCKGRVPKSEDWRKLDTDEKVAVERMDPEERVTALEFMIWIVDEGEPLDWKKHRERWPRKMRTAHMMKSRLLLAIIKMAKLAGGLREYLEESKKDVARKPVFPAHEEAAPRTPSPFRILDELLGGSDRDSNSGEDSDSDDSWRVAVPKAARGDLRGAKADPLLLSGTDPERVVDWRASSYLRGVDPGANVPPAAESPGAVRQNGQSGGSGRPDERGSSTGPSKLSERYSSDPDPNLDPSKIPRGFALRRRKGPPVRDNTLAFATWNTTNTQPPPPPTPVPTPPKPPIPSAQLRKGGMIQSAADRAAATSQFLFPGGDLPQLPTPPAREKRWPGIYEPKQAEEPTGGLVQPQLENLSERDRELLSAPSGGEALRDLSSIERRRRRRLLGIKVQRHEDVDELSNDNGVFEVVGRQQRSMREILSGYAQETVLMRGEDLAQPVLVEDDLRSSEEGLLERLVFGHKSEVEEFKDTSKQYVRAWQDFQTWSDFFKFKNKRMPTVTDVEATCIPWLVDKAKAYVVLRKHMIMLAEGNEKLLTAMATIQAELNKRSTAPMAADRAAAYRARANLSAQKKPVKRKPRAKKGVTETDLVAGSIMEALEGSEDDFD